MKITKKKYKKKLIHLLIKFISYKHKKRIVIGLLLDMERLKKIIRKRLGQKKNQKN
jgi:regulator of PEP synthase PpsR (kinase-PPPase family)